MKNVAASVFARFRGHCGPDGRAGTALTLFESRSRQRLLASRSLPRHRQARLLPLPRSMTPSRSRRRSKSEIPGRELRLYPGLTTNRAANVSSWDVKTVGGSALIPTISYRSGSPKAPRPSTACCAMREHGCAGASSRWTVPHDECSLFPPPADAGRADHADDP